MILLLTGCSESKKLSTNQSEDNNQIKYKSKDITINENLLNELVLVKIKSVDYPYCVSEIINQ